MTPIDDTGLEARVAALVRAELAAQRRARRRHRRGGRILATLCLGLLVALVPLTILAANPFADLTGGVHDPNIEAIYDAGVTKGCVPDQEYCPTANVTREEMASFLARLGGLGTNAPAANAKTVQGYAANGLARVAGAETISANLDGTFTAVATATITAPGPGYVLAIGTSSMYVTGGGGGACPCGAVVRVHQLGSSEVSLLMSLRTETATGTSESATATHVFPVVAGTYNFAVELQQVSGTKALTANGAITLLYVPFDGNGATPVILP